jgi:uncharacterized protein (DUF362 family)
MGRVFDEAEAELRGVLRAHAGRPRDAMLALLLMALEREEIVSLAYRQARIAARLRATPLPDDARRLLEHALVWVWKDEEMHMVYVRGALLRIGRWPTRLRAYLMQLGGAAAGWATSVVQHARWHQAPAARAAAGLVIAAGRAAGKVPREVGRLLRYCAFRDFCLFNAELERASWLCWDRLADLAADQPDVAPEWLAAFRRVVDDEEDHRRVFVAIAEALDGDDRLVDGATAADLAARIAEVGPHFLPRAARGFDDHRQPLGSGGDVWCVEGGPAEPAAEAFRRLLDDCGLADAARRAADRAGRPPHAVVKTCFMLGVHRGDPSPVVSSAAARELAVFLRRHGCADVALAEVPNCYDRFFAGRSVAEVARYWGFDAPEYRVIDLAAGLEPHRFSRGIGPAHVATEWRDADLRISLGRLRSHPVEQALLSLGNLEGMTGRVEDFIFTDRHADRATAVAMLLDDFPCHFALLDGDDAVPDGLAGMMGSVRPRAPRRFYASADPLALDAVVFRHLGSDPERSPLLRAACHWFGGWPSPAVRGCDRPLRPWRGPQADDHTALLSALALPVYVWGSGRGAMFLPAADPAAFPAIDRAGPATRWGRRTVRWLLGLPSGGRGCA